MAGSAGEDAEMTHGTHSPTAAKDQAIQALILRHLEQKPRSTDGLAALMKIEVRILKRYLRSLQDDGKISHPCETGFGPLWVIRRVRYVPAVVDEQTIDRNPKPTAPKVSWWLAAATNPDRSAFETALAARIHERHAGGNGAGDGYRRRGRPRKGQSSGSGEIEPQIGSEL